MVSSISTDASPLNIWKSAIEPSSGARWHCIRVVVGSPRQEFPSSPETWIPSRSRARTAPAWPWCGPRAPPSPRTTGRGSRSARPETGSCKVGLKIIYQLIIDLWRWSFMQLEVNFDATQITQEFIFMLEVARIPGLTRHFDKIM